MGRLYDLASAINQHLEATHAGDPMGLIRAKGALATRVGFLVSLVGRVDLDDPVKIAQLEKAAAELGVPVP